MAGQTYHSIQYLRGLAALMVVIFHLFSGSLFPVSAYTSWMKGGVDLFFVISGFIMVISTQGRDITPAAFFKKRIIRIVPLYWIMTLIMISAVGYTGWHSFASFLFIPAIYPGHDYMLPLVKPGWTLNYEMFFYTIFGSALLLRRQLQVPVVTAVLLAIVVFGLVLSGSHVGAFYTAPLILEFALGMWLAKMRLRFPVWVVPFGFILMAILYTDNSTRLFTLGLPAMLVVGGMLSVEARLPQWRAGLLIGDASYAIYLVHLMTLGLASLFWKAMFPMGWLYIPTGIAVTVLAGIVVHLVLEKPMTNILNQKLKSKDTRKHLAAIAKTA